MDTKQRILLVDDDPVIERVYTELFHQADLEVDVAATAEAAMAMLKENPPDAVLLDLFLPKVNGVEVLKLIRSQRITKDLPVIAFSTSSTSRHVEAAWREGVTKFFAKDLFKPAQIVAEIVKILADAKAAPKKNELDELEIVGESERKKAFESFPALKAELRDRWVALGNSEKEGRGLKIEEVFNVTQKLVAQAATAEVGMMLQTFRPLDAFFKELKSSPASMGLSAMRTSVQAVDFAEVLCDYAVQVAREPLVPGLILLASDRVSSSDLSQAMKRTNLTIVGSNDVNLALKLCEENRFQLIFWDSDLPGPSRTDVLKRIREESKCRTAPVVCFVKSDAFEGLAREAASGGFDLVARPISPFELAIKATTYIVREGLNALSVHT